MDEKDILIIKIKKRINIIANCNKKYPEKIYVTPEESNILDDIAEIDNVKLVVRKDAKAMTNCKFYNKINNDCNAMTELICSYKKCKRYNTTIDLNEVEDSIKKYVKKVRDNGKEKA